MRQLVHMNQIQNELDELWEYVEPHESGGTCYVRMTKKQAIDWMHKYIYEYLRHTKELTEEELFQEWIVVNWAYKYEKETNTP